MLKNLFVFAGWLLLLCLVLLFCITTGLWLNWKTTSIFMVWLGILTVGVILWASLLWLTWFIKEKKIHRFFRKYRLSRMERVLFEHWKSGAALVKQIKRKRPAIPWFIMLGDRCGKTSLLAGAGLPVFSKDAEEITVVPTHTLCWWFFHNVCLLDLSSHFVRGISSFNRAWGKLAVWISRLPAPAGIIICISVDDLLNEDVSTLHDKARKIRVQLELLTRKLRRHIPIQIIINQCDKFPAFSLWTQQLSAAQHRQALGYYWAIPPDVDGKDTTALQPLFAALRRGMDLARVSMTGTPVSPETHGILLDFPEAFARLQTPLQVFLGSLCESSPCFTPVSPVGVWFTSCEAQDKHKSRRTAYFVQELLTRHLPELSTTRGMRREYNQGFRPLLRRLLLLGCVAMIAYSAIRSASLMHGNTAELSPAALAELLEKNERHLSSPLSHLLFMPIISRQHQQVEEQLRKKVPTLDLNVSQVLGAYQQQFMVALPQARRQMVLDLAQTILSRERMRKGASLESLMQEPAIPVSLHLISLDSDVTPLARQVIERWVMQQPTGAGQMEALHRLLTTLINVDPSLTWLVAPVDSLPVLQASSFWPHLTNIIPLSGVWTRQGGRQLEQWLNLINQADGKAVMDPVLQRFVQELPIRRQDAWQQQLLSVTRSLQGQTPSTLSQNQLIAVSQGHSPAMRFARYVRYELDDIPAEHTQPWLNELRLLQELQERASENPTLQAIRYADTQLRDVLKKWSGGEKTVTAGNTATLRMDAWRMWQSSLDAAVSEAFSQTTLSPALTAGLFEPASDAKNSNPLATLFTHFDKLRKSFDSTDLQPAVNAVWLLYQSDASVLLAHAMARSGCWFNAQWQSRVMLPVHKNTGVPDYDNRQMQAWQYITDFLRGPASGLLTFSVQGPEPGTFRHQSLPLTPQFLNVVRNMSTEVLLDDPERKNTRIDDALTTLSDKIKQLNVQQKALEAQPYSISISSGPATIPNGARVLPTGISLTLECQNGVRVLNSMNFSEQVQFAWQPGQCQRVTLMVNFPDFSASYQYEGNNAWPEFLKQFAQNEALLNVQDFSENADTLSELGIRQVLVRFKLSDPQLLLTAWLEWSALHEQIAELSARKELLEDQKQNILSSAPLRGRLSELPENAAACL